MNYLAHIYLARQSDDAMVGALLGDFAKANAIEACGADIARNIRIHEGSIRLRTAIRSSGKPGNCSNAT